MQSLIPNKMIKAVKQVLRGGRSVALSILEPGSIGEGGHLMTLPIYP